MSRRAVPVEGGLARAEEARGDGAGIDRGGGVDDLGDDLEGWPVSFRRASQNPLRDAALGGIDPAVGVQERR